MTKEQLKSIVKNSYLSGFQDCFNCLRKSVPSIDNKKFIQELVQLQLKGKADLQELR